VGDARDGNPEKQEHDVKEVGKERVR